MSWVANLKYLGEYLVAGKYFSADVSTNCMKFFGSARRIFKKCGAVSEEIKWHVIGHNTLTILLYGVGSAHLTSKQEQKLSVAYNNSVRRCSFCITT